MARTDSRLLRNVSRTFARFFLDRGYSIDDVTTAMRIACHEYVRAKAAIDGTNIKAVAAKHDVNDRAVRRYTNNKASLRDLYEVTMLAFFRARPMKPMTAENAALFLLREHNKIAQGAENEGIDPREIAAALEKKGLLKSSLVGCERVYFAEGGTPIGDGDELAALWTFGSPEMANVVTALESYFDADPARSDADDERFVHGLLEDIERSLDDGGAAERADVVGRRSAATVAYLDEHPKSSLRMRVVAGLAAAAALFGVVETHWLSLPAGERPAESGFATSSAAAAPLEPGALMSIAPERLASVCTVSDCSMKMSSCAECVTHSKCDEPAVSSPSASLAASSSFTAASTQRRDVCE